MGALVLNTGYQLYERNGKAFCDSLQIADTFHRRHAHVIDTIEALTQPTSGLSEEFRFLNFEASSYKDSSGKRNKKYLLTKDGFVMVTMEFKTVRARQFKEAYIHRFNQMEAYIQAKTQLKPVRRNLTDTIKALGLDKWAYGYYTNLAYIVAVGGTAAQLREQREGKSLESTYHDTMDEAREEVEKVAQECSSQDYTLLILDMVDRMERVADDSA